MRANPAVKWRKSSYSGGTGDCVELATYVAPGHRLVTTAMRDSKDPKGLALSFRLDEWAAFALKVKAGEYDLQIR